MREKYLRVCSIIGGAAGLCGNRETGRRLSVELEHAPIGLDNFLYENFGMSGKEIADSFLAGLKG